MILIAAAAAVFAIAAIVLRAMLLIPGANRPDTAPPQSSGLFHTLYIRAANRWRRNRTDKENRMARGKNPSDFSNATERADWVRDNPNAPFTCSCGGRGCRTCGDDGTMPTWVVDPEVTGYPHERASR
jgi:hypothetical protein